MPFLWLVAQVLGLVQVSQVGARKLRFSAQDSTMNFHQVSKVAVQVQWACRGYQRDRVLSSLMGILGSSPQDELEGVWVLILFAIEQGCCSTAWVRIYNILCSQSRGVPDFESGQFMGLLRVRVQKRDVTIDLSTVSTLRLKQQCAIREQVGAQFPQRKLEGKRVQTTETTPHGGLQMKGEDLG